MFASDLVRHHAQQHRFQFVAVDPIGPHDGLHDGIRKRFGERGLAEMHHRVLAGRARRVLVGSHDHFPLDTGEVSAALFGHNESAQFDRAHFLAGIELLDAKRDHFVAVADAVGKKGGILGE